MNDNWNELVTWCTDNELADLITFIFDSTVDFDIGEPTDNEWDELVDMHLVDLPFFLRPQAQ